MATKQKYFITSSAPTTGDDNTQGYEVGDKIFDTTNDLVYVAIDVSTGAAIWIEVVGRTLTQTLTNKTLTTPVINSPTGIGQQRFIIKASTETVNNSTTVQNDDDFSFAIAANEKWLVEMYVLLQGVSVNADFKMAFTAPAACTLYYGYNGLTSAIFGWGAASAAATPSALASSSGTELAAGAANSIGGVRITGIFANGANAGTIQWQWAQNTLTAENLSVLANSVMIYTRLA